MDIKQINSAIMYGAWTNDQLNSMIDAVKFNRKGLSGVIKISLQMGSRVRWTSDKNPRGEGTVTKIARKFVTVRTDAGGLWRVPANMLELVQREMA
jgi:hypothetical protein